MTLLADLVAASADVAATNSRKAKAERLAEVLRGLEPGEVAIAVGYLVGAPRQGRIGIGWAALQELGPAGGSESSLTVAEIDAALAALAEATGAGSQARRQAILADLVGRATPDETDFLFSLLLGDVRQGALAGVMSDAVARAAGVPAALVRRAAMLRGDLSVVAAAALAGGAAELETFGLEVGRPVEPMLAKTAASVADALDAHGGRVAVEWKLDGARVQVHRSGRQVWIFTRNLRDVTAGLPDVVEQVLGFPGETMVLDGEVIALDAGGRPLPFQATMSRFGSGEEREHPLALTSFFFDVLHLDGVDLIDEPADARFEALARAVGDRVVPRLVTENPTAAEEFAAAALAGGHEGVMVKDLAAPYAAGRRGAAWLKVKPAHNLDLVVLAAEWGHGRRTGKLSNLHLGARDPATGEFVMLGKTFKGLTDEMLAWQTERFLELAIRREEHIVHVRPELVVEVAFDGVQASSRYPGGMALRFARVKGYRRDKPAEQADTIDTVRAIFEGARLPG